MSTTETPSGNVEQPVKAIKDVLREIRDIRQELVAARAKGDVIHEDWSDLAANEGYIKALFEEHQELANGYPVLLRDAVQNQDFSLTVVKKYFRWASNGKNLEKVAAAAQKNKKKADAAAGLTIGKKVGAEDKENSFLRMQAEYCYFDARVRQGPSRARLAATAAYEALLSEDKQMKSAVDTSVDGYYAQVKAAKAMVIERMKAALADANITPDPAADAPADAVVADAIADAIADAVADDTTADAVADDTAADTAADAPADTPADTPAS
jgi:hypothetical protein